MREHRRLTVGQATIRFGMLRRPADIIGFSWRFGESGKAPPNLAWNIECYSGLWNQTAENGGEFPISPVRNSFGEPGRLAPARCRIALDADGMLAAPSIRHGIIGRTQRFPLD
jgi:hypothetical protein